MLPTANTAAQDLQKHSTSLRFPPALEREFLRDFGERQPPMLRRFFALGLALYMPFAILDYFAMTTYYPSARALRLVCDKYDCVPGSLIDVKGKGEMNVWHVLRAR